MAKWLVLAAVTSLVLRTEANPKFNKVNSVDVNGQQCPLIPVFTGECPFLCVRNPARDCPTELYCSAHQQYCPSNGQCINTSEQCRGDASTNPCMCGDVNQYNPRPMSDIFYSCPKKQTVNVTNFRLADYDRDLQNQCAMAYELGAQDVLTSSITNSPSTKLLLQCSPHSSFNGREVPLFVYYGVVAWLVLIVPIWMLFKRLTENKTNQAKDIENDSQFIMAQPAFPMRRSIEMDLLKQVTDPRYTEARKERMSEARDSSEEGRPSTSSSTPTVSNSPFNGSTIQLQGYKGTPFGAVGFYSITFGSVFFFVAQAFLTMDYYNFFGHHIFGNTDGDSLLFMIGWHILGAWLILIKAYSVGLKNLFRLRCDLETAEYIEITQPVQRTKFIDTSSRLMRFLDKVEQLTMKMKGGDFSKITVPVLVSELNERYFEYQCQRHTFDTNLQSFEAYQVPDMSDEQIKARGLGLTSKRAGQIASAAGPNVIKVHVDTFVVALGKEFASFFYIYQLLALTVWYYLSYYWVALCLTVVIGGSAIIKVVTKLNAENRVKTMAEDVTQVNVLRDDRWVRVSSATLVPGDVIEIEEHSKLAVDAVLINGEAVMNESGLTGESTPQRRFPLK